jgi:hypothetical protein
MQDAVMTDKTSADLKRSKKLVLVGKKDRWFLTGTPAACSYWKPRMTEETFELSTTATIRPCGSVGW